MWQQWDFRGCSILECLFGCQSAKCQFKNRGTGRIESSSWPCWEASNTGQVYWNCREQSDFFTSFCWHKCSELYLKREKKNRREEEKKRKREMWTLLTCIWWNLSVTQSHTSPALALGGEDRLCWGRLPRSPGGNVQLPEVGIDKSPGCEMPARQRSSSWPRASRFPCCRGKHCWPVNPRGAQSSHTPYCQIHIGPCSS